MSSRPSAAMTSATARSVWASWAWSALCRINLPSCPGSRLRPVMWTVAPASINPSATPLPTPLLAPVTSATTPYRSGIVPSRLAKNITRTQSQPVSQPVSKLATGRSVERHWRRSAGDEYRSSMFECVVLLTGPGERSILSARLAAFRPDLNIIAAGSRADLLALAAATLARSRLIAFTTSVIVPPEVLAGLGHGAYNYHPGSPEYPGLSPAQFAIYDGARSFGATVHRMASEVAAGP